MAQHHKDNGSRGGQRTVELYGTNHMQEIGRRGGRPTWQQELEREAPMTPRKHRTQHLAPSGCV